MNETCDVNLRFSSSEFWTKQFLIKLIITFIPIFVMFFSVFQCKEKIFKSKWILTFHIIVWILVACILVWTWYKISKMCSTRAYINLLFIIFMIFQSIYFYLIGQNDTKNAKITIGIMVMLGAVLFIYIYYIQKTAPMLIFIIEVWLFYIAHLTYKIHDDNFCDKCGEEYLDGHKCKLCKKCNKYFNKKHKCK